MSDTTSGPTMLIDGKRSLRLVIRKAWVVIALIIIGAAAALIYQRNANATYSASAQVQVGYTPVDSIIEGQYLPTSDPDVLQATQVAVLNSPTVLNAATARLGHKPSVTVAAVSNSQVISISASSASASGAARDANAYVAVYLKRARSTTTAELNQLKAHLTKAIATEQRELGKTRSSDSSGRTSLRSQLTNNTTQLGTVESALASSPTGVTEVSAAQPPTASSGLSAKEAALIGGAFALVISLAMILIFGSRDDSISGAAEMETESGVPFLASLRASNGGSHSVGGAATIVASQIVHQLPGQLGVVLLIDASGRPASGEAAQLLSRAISRAGHSVVAVALDSGEVLHPPPGDASVTANVASSTHLLPAERVARLAETAEIVVVAAPSLEDSAVGAEVAPASSLAIVCVGGQRVSANKLLASVRHLRRVGLHVIGLVQVEGRSQRVEVSSARSPAPQESFSSTDTSNYSSS